MKFIAMDQEFRSSGVAECGKEYRKQNTEFRMGSEARMAI